MTDKKGVFDLVAYIFGIVSVTLAFFNSLAGIAFGIIGIIQSKKENTELSKKARKLSIIGIVLSIVLFIVLVTLIAYLESKSIKIPGLTN